MVKERKWGAEKVKERLNECTVTNMKGKRQMLPLK